MSSDSSSGSGRSISLKLMLFVLRWYTFLERSLRRRNYDGHLMLELKEYNKDKRKDGEIIDELCVWIRGTKNEWIGRERETDITAKTVGLPKNRKVRLQVKGYRWFHLYHYWCCLLLIQLIHHKMDRVKRQEGVKQFVCFEESSNSFWLIDTLSY